MISTQSLVAARDTSDDYLGVGVGWGRGGVGWGRGGVGEGPECPTEQ